MERLVSHPPQAGRPVKEGWPVAPSILEEIYTMEDALAFGGACISLLNTPTGSRPRALPNSST